MVDLVIVVPHLGAGGVQRVASTLANAWSREGRRIVIVTLYEESLCYAIDPQVKVLSVLDSKRAPYLLRAIETLRCGLRPFSRNVVRGLRLVTRPLRELGRRGLAAFSGWMGWEASGEEPRIVVRLRKFVASLRRKLSPLRIFERFFEGLPPKHRLSGLWKLYLPALLRVRALREIVAELQPRALLGLCGSTSVMTALAGEALSMPVIISERNDPSRQRLEAPWNGFRKHFYERADVVTANTRGALDAMSRYVDPAKLHFVPNPLLRPALPSPAITGATILTVGRLHPQKAQTVLIRALAALEADLEEWRLRIVGRGVMGGELRDLGDRLGVGQRIDWIGQVDDPLPHYAAAQIFALPSLHEGTPNALLEAMSLGLAVVVSDASPGPLELVDHGRTGLVVRAGDPESLARALEQLARDSQLRSELGEAARERVAEYDLPRALRSWERVLGWQRDPSPSADCGNTKSQGASAVA